MAKHYGVPVVLHSDHCAKKLLPWFDGMLEADEEYFKVYMNMLSVFLIQKQAISNVAKPAVQPRDVLKMDISKLKYKGT